MAQPPDPQFVSDITRSTEDLVTRLQQANAGIRETIAQGKQLVRQSRELIGTLPASLRLGNGNPDRNEPD